MTYTGSRAFAGQGTQLQLGDSSGGASTGYTTIAEATKIQRSGSKADSVDVTNMDSTGAYREILPTLLTPGDISVDLNYIPGDSTQQQLQTLFDGRTKRDWKLVLPASLGHWDFNAYVTSVDFDVSFDKQGTISAKLTITGQPVFTPGS